MFSFDFILGDTLTRMPYHSKAHRQGKVNELLNKNLFCSFS